MHQYQYGDFVYGVSPEHDSIFYYEDFCLAMVVEPEFKPVPRILLLCSTFLNKNYNRCTKEDFIKEVKRIRANPSLYEDSLFTDKYQQFVMSPDGHEYICPFSPTKESYADMLHQMQILHHVFGEKPVMNDPLLSFEEFSSRYLSPGFLSTSPKLSL